MQFDTIILFHEQNIEFIYSYLIIVTFVEEDYMPATLLSSRLLDLHLTFFQRNT